MAVLLALIGIGLYGRFEAQLDQTINQGLRARAGDVALFLQRPPAASARAPQRARGPRRELRADPRARRDGRRRQPVAARQAPADRRRGARRRGRRQTFLSRRNPFESEPARLLATPVSVEGRRLLVVVGTDSDDRDAALRNLLLMFLIGGPVALLLASLAGYGVASAALAPVEQMRRKAAQITDHTPGDRLPVGRTDDEIARLGTTLNTMLERLERSFERERAFVADASHELRTPLAILKTEIELALRAGRTQDELVEALRSAGEETDRLTELAEALLIIARADGGGLALAPAPLGSDELLTGVAARFAARTQPERSRDRRRRWAGGGADGRPPPARAGARQPLENALHHGAGTIHLAARTRGERRRAARPRRGAGLSAAVHRPGVRTLHAGRSGARARRQRPRAVDRAGHRARPRRRRARREPSRRRRRRLDRAAARCDSRAAADELDASRA